MIDIIYYYYYYYFIIVVIIFIRLHCIDIMVLLT